MYVNNVVVVGNLTADPRTGEADGVKVANFRMAVNRWRKPGQDGHEDIKERTEFIDVECWGSQAANVEATLHRGDRSIVAGQLRYDQWTDEAGNIKPTIFCPRQRRSIQRESISAPASAWKSAPMTGDRAMIKTSQPGWSEGAITLSA